MAAVLSLRWVPECWSRSPSERAAEESGREVNRWGSMISRASGVGRLVGTQVVTGRKTNVTVAKTSEGPELELGLGAGSGEGEGRIPAGGRVEKARYQRLRVG